MRGMTETSHGMCIECLKKLCLFSVHLYYCLPTPISYVSSSSQKSDLVGKQYQTMIQLCPEVSFSLWKDKEEHFHFLYSCPVVL